MNWPSFETQWYAREERLRGVMMEEEDKQGGNELWLLPTTGMIKRFIWKSFHNTVPVKEVLSKEGCMSSHLPRVHGGT